MAGDAPDDAVPAHYGEVFGEQRALAAGRGYVDLSHRGVVRVTGPDRLSWLHRLVPRRRRHVAFSDGLGGFRSHCAGVDRRPQ